MTTLAIVQPVPTIARPVDLQSLIACMTPVATKFRPIKVNGSVSIKENGKLGSSYSMFSCSSVSVGPRETSFLAFEP